MRSGRGPSGIRQDEKCLAYLNFVADRLDLRRDIRLNTRVESARYDEDANTWTVQIEGGAPLVAKYLISGMGCCRRPSTRTSPASTPSPARSTTPRIGRGTAWTWPANASARSGSARREFRSCPRSPRRSMSSWCSSAPPTSWWKPRTTPSPKPTCWLRDNYDAIYEKAANHPFGVAMEPAPFSALEVSDEQRRAIFEGKWNEGGFHFANECFNDLATNHAAASELASEFIRSKIREIVKDPATAELLSPKTYSFNGKRVPHRARLLRRVQPGPRASGRHRIYARHRDLADLGANELRGHVVGRQVVQSIRWRSGNRPRSTCFRRMARRCSQTLAEACGFVATPKGSWRPSRRSAS